MENEKKLPVIEEKTDLMMSAFFNNLPEMKTNENLYISIIAEIKCRTVLKEKRKVAVISSMGILSFAAFIYTWILAAAQVRGSGITGLFSLLFYDLKIVSSDWQYFVMYFLETIPAAAIIYALTSTMAVMLLAKFLFLSLSNKNRLTHV